MEALGVAMRSKLKDEIKYVKFSGTTKVRRER